MVITVRYIDEYGQPTEKYFEDCWMRSYRGALEIYRITWNDDGEYFDETIAAFSNWIWAHKEERSD